MPGTRKLGRPSDHRKAMLRGMVTFLLENGKIETTVTRAKEVRAEAEKMITLGKVNTLHTKRRFLHTLLRKMSLRRYSTRSLPSTLTRMVVTQESTRSVRAAATQQRWLSSSWFNFRSHTSLSDFGEGFLYLRKYTSG